MIQYIQGEDINIVDDLTSHHCTPPASKIMAEEAPCPRRVYVGGLPLSAKSSDLMKLLGKLVPVTSVYTPDPAPTGITGL